MHTKLIYNALAFKDDGKARKLKMSDRKNSKELYLRNSFVSLISAKSHVDNDTDLALITNMPLDDKWSKLFAGHGIDVHLCPFDSFRMEGIPWELAFYKLCALDYATNTLQYEHLLAVDADTVFIRDTAPLFEESSAGSVLLYEVLYGIRQPMRTLINNDYQKFTGNKKVISQWGGELLCMNNRNAKELLRGCKKYYDLFMQEAERHTVIGDEYFLTLAACDMEHVRNAAPYIERMWTRGRGYYASTRYTDEYCIILHLLAEKSFGINHLFSYYQQHGCLPGIERIASICNLPKVRGKHVDRYLLKVILSSVWNKLFRRKTS